MRKITWFHISELKKDFDSIAKRIKELLTQGYTVLIVDWTEWGYYSLYTIDDFKWFIEWVLPSKIHKIKELF